MWLGTQDKTTHPLLDKYEEISGHRLIRCRGRGGVATIWEAESPTGQRVALKLVDGAARLHGGELRALELMRQVRHPSLLEVLGTWQVEDLLVISMELGDRSLWDRFLEARAEGLRGIPRRELLGYLRPVAEAVDYLNDYQHAIAGRRRLGIQHRDLKPQNIVLVGGAAKVADFGLARVMERMVVSHTGPCTMPYAAPEYFRGCTSRRSDQYALAVTYCQLRGGRAPFAGTTAQIAFGHLCHAPDLSSLPEPERPIVARALAKAPEARWPDCRSFVATLQALASGQDGTIPDGLPRPPRDDDDDDRFADCDPTPVEGPGLEPRVDACDSADEPSGGWPARVGPLYVDGDRVEIFTDAARSIATEERARSEVQKHRLPATQMTQVRSKWRRVGRAVGMTAALCFALSSPRAVIRPDAKRERMPEEPTAAAHAPNAPFVPPALTTEAPAPDPADGPFAEDPSASEAPVASDSTAPPSSDSAPARIASRIDDPQPSAWDLPIAQSWGLHAGAVGEPTAAEIYRAWGLGPLLSDHTQRPLEAPEGSAAVAGLLVPATVTIIAGQTAGLRIRVPGRDTSMPLHLEFRRLPPGISMVASAVTLGTDTVDLELSAADDAPSGSDEASVICTVGKRSDEARCVIKVLAQHPRGHL
jgi:hypothetical protein